MFNTDLSKILHEKMNSRLHFKKLRQELKINSSEYNWGSYQFSIFLNLMKLINIDPNQSIIASYVPFQSELNLNLKAKNNWIFPKTSINNSLKWFFLKESTPLSLNKYSLIEAENTECFDLEEIEKFNTNFQFQNFKKNKIIVFVPGLAADKSNYRLGYGNGYYDRFISKYRDIIITILALPSKDFIVEHLPIETHDEKIDYVIY